MTILNKNAVITGAVDSLCLVCEEHLCGDDDVVLHIAEDTHKKNLEAISLFDKYKDDRIWKVKKGYYCEYCNVFLKTPVKVNIHVIEPQHCERKGFTNPFKRQGNGVVALGKVFISENTWHGFSDSTCSLCDDEFDNALSHKTETAHILNLVLAEIEITDGNVYRKVDNSSFQCLTCNVIWVLNDMTAHFDGENHKKQYQQCCESAKNLINEPETATPKAAKKDNQKDKIEKSATNGETFVQKAPEVTKTDNQDKKTEESTPKVETSIKDTPDAVKIDNQIERNEKCAPKAEAPTKETQEVAKIDTENEKAEKDAPKAETSIKETPEVAKKDNQNEKNDENAPKAETSVKEIPEVAKKDDQQEKTEEDASKAETSNNTSENEIPKDKTKDTPEAKNVEANEGTKKPETKKKPECKKKKSAKFDKMGKVDKEICEALGAQNYIATSANGGQWCILCDWTMDQKAIQGHLTSKHHLTILKMHRERAAQRDPENDEDPDDNDDDPEHDESPDENKTSKTDKKTQNENKILDAADEFQKNNIKLDMVLGSAHCRGCGKSVDYDFDVIKDHIDEHKKALKPEKSAKPEKAAKPENAQKPEKASKPEKVTKPETTQKPEKAPKNGNLKTIANDTPKTTALVTNHVQMNGNANKPKKEKEEKSKQNKGTEPTQDTILEMEKYAKENKLTYNKETNIVFCSVCFTKVPSTLKNMREHINGANHKNIAAQLNVIPEESVVAVVTKVPTKEFIENVVTMEALYFKDVVVNEKYCLNVISFLMLTRVDKNLRCEGCDVDLTVSEIDAHKKSKSHLRAMSDTPVLSSERKEFIRECRPDVYHCGYCNEVETPWSTMETHLRSTEHLSNRVSAFWRIQSHGTEIMRQRARQTMQYMMFNRMSLGEMYED